MPRISQINLFPVKSCSGYPVETAELESRGFVGDRRYMLVDERGMFLTQRAHPRMALIRMRSSVGGFVAGREGLTDLELPAKLVEGEARRVVVWGDEVEATAAGAGINGWFSAAIGARCELVYTNRPGGRGVKSGYGRAEDDLSFADGSPVLLISEESLGALNERLDAPVEMIRFRPNLVVKAGTAFAEDGWRRIRVGDAEFDVEWPCTRCPIPTVDPETGIKDRNREPLRALNEFRGGLGGTTFGQNLIPRSLGRARVGDPIEIIEIVESRIS